ncbi:hypothetical protein BGW36DRAFT_134665 [Talaromyces proteolyticus]|uniref:Uncharacterized protein n=1 Tax=Talaromyces proteolyticus TaxID=1131652 RepID=A0AAD4KZJ7_9EURO|nr:uncharacterized protein BGW36DRAFT_134665 [Talaromyces proteolyticus]KAH8700710.1 hypothetical protein BGW36DRAFT_134665 [Talaromyces proteolyticus]
MSEPDEDDMVFVNTGSFLKHKSETPNLHSDGTKVRETLASIFPDSLATKKTLSSPDMNSGQKYRLMEHQVNRFTIWETEKVSALERKIHILEQQNSKQNAKLDFYATAKESESAKLRQMPGIPVDDNLLHRISSQHKEIQNLKLELSRAIKVNGHLSRISEANADMDMKTSITKFMDKIGTFAFFAADLLRRAFRNKSHQELQEYTRYLISESIANEEMLENNTSPSFQAILFKFMRDQIFYSKEMWTQLHFEGLILKEYQDTLQDAASGDFAVKFHRVVLRRMFERSDRFKQLFVLAHAERLRDEFMELFEPFIDITLLKRSNRDQKLQDHLINLFKDAIYLRAMCFPPSGTRYEMIHYKPSDLYQPDLMKVSNDHMQMIRPDNKALSHIKLCVHGSIVSHRVQETSFSGVDKIRDLTTSFVQKSDYNDRIVEHWGQELISDKATVIFE